MAYYRAKFPGATVLPKMHILVDHTIPWLQRWHLGAGLMGPSPYIHEKTYQGVAKEVDWLKYIFKTHMQESAPSLTILGLPIKKRKLEDERHNNYLHSFYFFILTSLVPHLYMI